MKFKYWIKAIRPKTLFASLSPCLLGISLAYLQKETLSYHFILNFINIITCALLLQISSNLINDYYDSFSGVDNSKRLGPLRVTSQNLISPKLIKKAFLITLSLSFILGFNLMLKGGIPIITIGIFSILCAFLYTGGPFPLSHYGLGEVFAYLFFGPIAVWGTYFILTNRFDFYPLIIGSGVGFLSSAIMAINNLRDTHSDQLTKKKTLSTIFGVLILKKIYLSFIFTSLAIALIDSFLFKRLTFLVVIIFIIHLKFFKEIYDSAPSSHYNLYLAKTAKFMFFYSVLLSIFIQVQF